MTIEMNNCIVNFYCVQCKSITEIKLDDCITFGKDRVCKKCGWHYMDMENKVVIPENLA